MGPWGSSVKTGAKIDEARQWLQRRLGRWYGAPALVVVLGVLAMALLLWTDQIREQQRMYFGFANALMDFQLKVATSRLWIEEAVAGGNAAVTERARLDLRELAQLSTVLLRGGETENGLFVQPVPDPQVRKRVQEVTRLASEWEMIVEERAEASHISGIGSASDDRGDSVLHELQRRATELDRIVEEDKTADYVRSRRLLAAMVVVWSAILIASVMGLVRRERRRICAQEALQEAKADLEQCVVARTKALASVNGRLCLELAEREKVGLTLRKREDQLQQLSVRLLSAQETERGRISAELHDDLAQSLVLMKLRLGMIENAVRRDLSAAEEHCRRLAESLDEIVENIRSLARGLTPSVLDDLGLSRALRWLADNYRRDWRMEIASSIADVDPLVAKDMRIVLYRVVQEALTNAGKHAHAQHVSLVVAKRGDHLAVRVEDDGNGFNHNENKAENGSARGLGLVTMRERARMLGGSLDVWSQTGKGTRITLLVPARNGNGGCSS